jgi:hypothetical protein
MAVEIRRADHGTLLYPRKLALTSLTSTGRSVGVVRSQTLLLFHVTKESSCVISPVQINIFELTPLFGGDERACAQDDEQNSSSSSGLHSDVGGGQKPVGR